MSEKYDLTLFHSQEGGIKRGGSLSSGMLIVSQIARTNGRENTATPHGLQKVSSEE
jgi:hypothetical protein